MRSLCLFLLLLSLTVAGKSQADGHLPSPSLAPQVESQLIPQRILVLDAYQPGLPIPESIERGLFAALRVGGFSKRNVFMEHLDFSRNPGSEVRAITVNLLLHKFSDKPVDIVITVGAQATDFMSREGKSLFPDAAVLTLISSNYMILSDDYDKVMAIPWQVDHAGTLKSALELFPETLQVFVVTGANDRIQSYLDEAKKAFGSWEGKLNFEYSNKLTYEEMRRRIASLPKNTIVIYTPFSPTRPGGLSFPLRWSSMSVRWQTALSLPPFTNIWEAELLVVHC